MKKYISVFVAVLFSLTVFSPTFAQSVNASSSIESTRQALIQVLTQLLQQLETQLQTLLAQRGNNLSNYNSSQSFSASPTSGTAPLAVQFKNTIQSAGEESIDYGDGTSCSTANPGFVDQSCNLLNHTYSMPGTYTAILYRHLPTTELARLTVTVVSSTQNQLSKLITIYAGPFSYRGDNKFWGNDDISFSWSSNYPITFPATILQNSQGSNVYSKDLSRGSSGSSAKFGEHLGINQNWTTGNYRIGVCDYENALEPICGWTNYFLITSTTTPFQP